ncbi:MAG: serine hydrolase, partial [Dehalococcoidia bacterium]
NDTVPYIPEGACFWGGWGGSLIVIDPKHRMTMAYVMNRMEEGLVGDFRGEALVEAAYAAIGTPAGV